jgi:hypothetical protein
MIPFTNIPEPAYKLDDTVWLRVPLNYLDADYNEPPVFECKVIGINLSATVQRRSEPTYSYEYEVEIISSLDAPLSRSAEHLYATESEACAATITEVEDLIKKRVKRTNMYGDILTVLYSKADK